MIRNRSRLRLASTWSIRCARDAFAGRVSGRRRSRSIRAIPAYAALGEIERRRRAERHLGPEHDHLGHRPHGGMRRLAGAMGTGGRRRARRARRWSGPPWPGRAPCISRRPRGCCTTGVISTNSRCPSGTKRRGSLRRVVGRPAGHPRDGRSDQPERGQAHRGDRPGQALGQGQAHEQPRAGMPADRLRIEGGDRPGLGQPEPAVPVERPLGVLGCSVVLLHPVAQLGQLQQLGVIEARVGAAVRPRHVVGAAAGPGEHGDPLVTDSTGDDGAAPDVDHEVVRVHGARHHGLAQPGAGVDHRLVPGAGDRVGGEHHTGDRRVHQPLHHHGQRDIARGRSRWRCGSSPPARSTARPSSGVPPRPRRRRPPR